MKKPEEILIKHCPSMDSLFLDTSGMAFRDRIVKAMEEYADQFKPKKIKPIEERINDFAELVIFHGGGPSANGKMLSEFISYWTEHSEGAKKMRFEKEKVFDIKKRLERWKRNNFNNGKSTKPTTDEAVNGFISH